jgi:hypothetical protein
MKKNSKINEKEIVYPARMYRKKTLEEMKINHVKKSIFFNPINVEGDFEKLNNNIKEHMIIINYPDCSQKIFNLKLLKKVIQKQLNSEADLIIIPYFKKETEHDVTKKILYLKEIRKEIDKKVILEIKYDSKIKTSFLEKQKKYFDFLSIYFGTYYGHLNQITHYVNRFEDVKKYLKKRIFAIGVPEKFSGNNIQESRYMPCFDLISDGWIKNWHPGRGDKNEIKLTDSKDLKCKKYHEWLETGHRADEIMPLVERTVHDMFNNASDREISFYHQLLGDEILSEIRMLTPYKVEGYLLKRFHANYYGSLVNAYSEKIIFEMFYKNTLFDNYKEEDKQKIELILREQIVPSEIYSALNEVLKFLEIEENVSVERIIKIINNKA